jgi:hypothetical protein
MCVHEVSLHDLHNLQEMRPAIIKNNKQLNDH